MEPKAPEAGSFLEAVAEEERERKSIVMMAPGAASLATHINMPAMWEREKVAGDMGGRLESGAGSWSRETGEGRRGRRSPRSTPWVGRWTSNEVMEEPSEASGDLERGGGRSEGDGPIVLLPGRPEKRGREWEREVEREKVTAVGMKTLFRASLRVGIRSRGSRSGGRSGAEPEPKLRPEARSRSKGPEQDLPRRSSSRSDEPPEARLEPELLSEADEEFRGSPEAEAEAGCRRSSEAVAEAETKPKRGLPRQYS